MQTLTSFTDLFLLGYTTQEVKQERRGFSKRLATICPSCS
ncbi:hypothetical protein SLEP1_g58160 [Rubroshorea leprosula]|uniref:Uncharacterized protein n=1 Tax=Rubroshorea leprosula TaxID=152421 RepID=A0AAV5MNU9_9ROSI|nr:hypothetical protein SLEP1_g58160 [Rubroshorea leprosula]